MALQPPTDFTLAAREGSEPSDAELRAAWRRAARERERLVRAAAWRSARERLRRGGAGDLGLAERAEPLAAGLAERLAFGPHARGALRPRPEAGGVLAVGVDTWSPCWYAEPGSPLARSLRALASRPAARAWLLPEPLAGHRVGWFPEPGLVFAEGRAGAQELLGASELAAALARLEEAIAALGIPLAGARRGGLRRLDVAADVAIDSGAEGLALLECLASASFGAGKIAAYRAQRRIESISITSRAGRTLARVYDKGAQLGTAPHGRHLRFEAQWRFARGARPEPCRLGPADLRRRFIGRFEALWQSAEGIRLGAPLELAERIGAAVAAGQLAPSRARTLAGYLLLGAAGVPQGARRTVCELERECRELGLALGPEPSAGRLVDAARLLDRCMASELWERSA